MESSSLCDTYKYTLNGINHEIPLHTNLQIRQKPLSNKILISQKYLLKYIHDLFDIHSIEYFLINHSLLGYHIFKGIHIFQPFAEICIGHHHLSKFLKIKNEIINDDFIIQELPNFFILSTTLFSKNPDTKLYIYILQNNINDQNESENENENTYSHFLYNNQKIYHNMFDIFPIQSLPFEEFHLKIPKKIENVLQNCNINLHLIQFENNNNNNNNNETSNITTKHKINKNRQIIETPTQQTTSNNNTNESPISTLFQISENIIHKIKQQFNDNP